MWAEEGDSKQLFWWVKTEEVVGGFEEGYEAQDPPLQGCEGGGAGRAGAVPPNMSKQKPY